MPIGFHYDDIEWESYYKEQEKQQSPDKYKADTIHEEISFANNKESNFFLCNEKQLAEGNLPELKDGTIVFVL